MEYINSYNPNFIKPLDFYITDIHFKNNNIYLDGVKNYDDLFNRLINYTIEHCINKPIKYNSKLETENSILKKQDENFIKVNSINSDDSNKINQNLLINPNKENNENHTINNNNFNNRNFTKELIEDINFMINNSKEIENLLSDKGRVNLNNKLKNNNQHLVNMKYEEKIFFLEKQISKINNEKVNLENQIYELKNLMNQFQLNYSSISPLFEEENDSLLKPNKIQKINSEISDQINQLFSNKLFNECYDLWKKYNFQLLTNSSVDRNFEILVYLLKLKDRNNKKNKNYDNNLSNEAKKKNCEIVELLSNIELYRVKLYENELKLNELKNYITNLIEQNNELNKQNNQLKEIIQNNY